MKVKVTSRALQEVENSASSEHATLQYVAISCF